MSGMHAIAVLLFAASLLPQQQAGPTVAGRVVDLDGNPVANAEVLLLHRDLPCVADGEALRVQARTDERGIFHATLQPHCTWSAWARWPGAASVVVEGVEANGFVELQQDPLAVARQIRLTGLDAYADRAPFRVQLSLGSINLELLSAPVTDGAVELPALACHRGQALEILDRSGEVLWTGEADAHEIEVPAPRELHLRVRGADGKAVAGAEIRSHLRNYWYTDDPAVVFMDRFRCLWPKLGVTDANGRLVVRVPVPGDADVPIKDLVLLARKDGMQGSLCGFHQGQAFREGSVEGIDDADAEPATADAELVFTLSPSAAAPRTLRLESVPAAAAPMALRWRLNIKRKNGGVGHPFVEITAAPSDGKLLLPAMPPNAEIEGAWVVMPEPLREQAAARFGFWPPRTYQPLQPAQLLQPDRVPLQLETMQPLTVIDADGRPAERAVLWITPLANRQPLAVRTDRLGRALAPGGTRVSVLTANGSGTLQLPDNPSDAAITLELRPLLVRTVRVHDQQGQPRAGVAMRLEITGQQAGSIEGLLPDIDLRALIEVLPTLRTDAEGRARLRLPEASAQLLLRIYRGVPPRPGTAQPIEAGSDPQAEIDVELPDRG